MTKDTHRTAAFFTGLPNDADRYVVTIKYRRSNVQKNTKHRSRDCCKESNVYVSFFRESNDRSIVHSRSDRLNTGYYYNNLGVNWVNRYNNLPFPYTLRTCLFPRLYLRHPSPILFWSFPINRPNPACAESIRFSQINKLHTIPHRRRASYDVTLRHSTTFRIDHAPLWNSKTPLVRRMWLHFE